MPFSFKLPNSSGLLKLEDYRVVINGISRFWNRRVIWAYLFVWFIFISYEFDILELVSKNSLILYLISLFAYIGSLDKIFVLEGSWKKGWVLKFYIGNSLFYYNYNKIELIEFIFNFIVYSTRIKAMAWLKVDDYQIKIRNIFVNLICEELNVLNIENKITSFRNQ